MVYIIKKWKKKKDLIVEKKKKEKENGDNKEFYTKSLILRVKTISLERAWISLTIIAYIL